MEDVTEEDLLSELSHFRNNADFLSEFNLTLELQEILSAYLTTPAGLPMLPSSSLPVTNMPLVSSTYFRTNSSANSTSHTDSIWEVGKVRIPLYSIIFLLGVLGNTLVILTLVQNTRMRTITNVYLLNLAISDLLLGVFCMPFTLLGTLLRDFIFGETLCKLIPYLQATSVSVSGWTLVAMSVERFFAICHPLTSRRWQTLRHARRIILMVWAASLVAMSPIAVVSQLQPIGQTGRHKCREAWPNATMERIFTVALDVLLLVLPLIIMVATYSLIADHLWRDNRDIHSENCARPSSSADVVPCLPPRMSPSGSPSSTSSTKPANSTVHHSAPPGSQEQPRTAANPAPFQSSVSLKSWRRHRPGLKSSQSVTSSTSQAPQSLSLRRMNAEQCLRTKRRVVKMLFVVVLEFFVCWTPLYVINTWSLFEPRAIYEGLGSIGISMVQLLAHASCCSNPITYCFMSSSFRRAFLAAFGCLRKEVTVSEHFRSRAL